MFRWPITNNSKGSEIKIRKISLSQQILGNRVNGVLRAYMSAFEIFYNPKADRWMKFH